MAWKRLRAERPLLDNSRNPDELSSQDEGEGRDLASLDVNDPLDFLLFASKNDPRGAISCGLV